MKKYLLLLFMAYVTMYGATGQKTSSGAVPFVGGVACPRIYHLGTRIRIMEIPFVCNDHTARKYDGRFDVFSTGTRQQMLKFGKQKLEVTFLLKK